MVQPGPAGEATGYGLLDSGDGAKLERFGTIVLDRPCAQAIWRRRRPADWAAATARFRREQGHHWQGRERLPEKWEVTIDGIRFGLSSTDFGHLGVFPEQRDQWTRLRAAVSSCPPRPRVLNLFAYSGGSTLACALAGAEVCHVDASAGMVDWARANASANGLAAHPIRWIVDDVAKFLERERRRDRQYDGVILDPPSYGRGSRGEVFKVERDLQPLLDRVAALLSPSPAFVLLTCHTPELTPVALSHLLRQSLPNGRLEEGEMLLRGEADVLPVPSGSWSWWAPAGPSSVPSVDGG